LARRILLADDSVTAQNMGRRILGDAGYEVVTVNNGSAALKKIAENKPDIIVLDVYMPGYGGLEVCQRVKQSPDTARIPVLLTVGKLEPFKPEEARRVGADAFIIKPFEATELLTALTKLEDKIVAAPQPQKSGRFARALAAVEQSTGERFGDKETGWKNRLTIPAPNARPAEVEVPETFAGPARDFDRSEAARPAESKPEFERPIPAGLPADITPEEIAAITAAAAAFDGKAAHPTVIPEGSASGSVAAVQAASAEISAAQSSPPEAPAATLASATEPQSAHPVELAAAPPFAPEAVSEPIASGASAAMEEPTATAELPAVEAEKPWVPPALAASQTREPEKSPPGDDEVMAAIASLAPSNGNGSESAPPLATSTISQEVPVAVGSVVAAQAGVSGSRWIAESVAVTIEESAPTLEQEMELASQARIAAEAARTEVAATAVVEVQAAEPVAEAAAPQVTAEVSLPEAVATTEIVAAPESVVAASVAEETVAQQNPVEPSQESPAIESLVPETIVAARVVPEISSVESSPVQSASPQASSLQTLEPEAKEESAFAAAAAAGSSSEPVSAVEAVSSTTIAPVIAENVPAASVEAAPQREAELAAAWQNWKQIRESFVSAQPAGPAAAEAKAVEEEATAPAEPEEEEETSELEASAAEAPGESTAIASIVDTMLAELRPKLVEEIAKKMKSEKKEKEKEKEKKKRR
jgi:twitching motility two-component system response regulator PilH